MCFTFYLCIVFTFRIGLFYFIHFIYKHLLTFPLLSHSTLDLLSFHFAFAFDVVAVVVSGINTHTHTHTFLYLFLW